VTQPLEVAACLSLVLACTASGQRASWRHDQELLIVEAVLLDLAEMPPMSDAMCERFSALALRRTSAPRLRIRNRLSWKH